MAAASLACAQLMTAAAQKWIAEEGGQKGQGSTRHRAAHVEIQEPKDSAPISTENSITHADDVVQATPPQISSAPVDPFENMVLEQRARDRTKGGTHRPRVELLRNSITNTLRLLHDYQQYRYQRRDLTQSWPCSESARKGSGRHLIACQFGRICATTSA